MVKNKLALIFIVMAAFVAACSLMYWVFAPVVQIAPPQIETKNVTISEKYSAGYGTTYRIVDTDGELFVVNDQNVWAFFKIGSTYCISYTKGYVYRSASDTNYIVSVARCNATIGE